MDTSDQHRYEAKAGYSQALGQCIFNDANHNSIFRNNSQINRCMFTCYFQPLSNTTEIQLYLLAQQSGPFFGTLKSLLVVGKLRLAVSSRDAKGLAAWQFWFDRGTPLRPSRIQHGSATAYHT